MSEFRTSPNAVEPTPHPRATAQPLEVAAPLEEFSILELEERLEFALCCDYHCNANTNCVPGCSN